MNAVITVDNVSKKFRLGDYHASLRELLPALASKALRRKRQHVA